MKNLRCGAWCAAWCWRKTQTVCWARCSLIYGSEIRFENLRWTLGSCLKQWKNVLFNWAILCWPRFTNGGFNSQPKPKGQSIGMEKVGQTRSQLVFWASTSTKCQPGSPVPFWLVVCHASMSVYSFSPCLQFLGQTINREILEIEQNQRMFATSRKWEFEIKIDKIWLRDMHEKVCSYK